MKEQRFDILSFIFGIIFIIPFTIAGMLFHGTLTFWYFFEDLILQRDHTDKETTTRQLNKLRGAGLPFDHPIFKSKFYIQNEN